MTRLVWDRVGDRVFQTGVNRGVLYPRGQDGVAWNGLTALNESPTGGEAKPFYVDGYKYANKASREEFEGTIEAFTYPPEFDQCEGTAGLGRGLYVGSQRRRPFSLSYRTLIGNDTKGLNYGYKIHLVYNALVSPVNRAFSSNGQNVDPLIFSWPFTTKPIRVPGHRPVPHMIIDSTKTTSTLLTAIEDILYGSAIAAPRMPLPSEVITLFAAWPELLVVDNGDGTFTVDGPDDIVSLLNTNTFQISSDSVVVAGQTFSVTSA